MSNFRFIEPKSKEQVLRVLGDLGMSGKIVAGCTNVLPNLRSKKMQSCTMVNISGLEELKGIEIEGDRVSIGALTTLNELMHSEVIRENAGILFQASQQFADPLVRNQATIAGNLANASPAADGVVPLMALDAIIRVESLMGGLREIPICQFMTGPGKTVLKPEELIVSISFSSLRNQKSSFIKFGLRKSMAISLVTVGTVLGLEEDIISQISIAMGAVAPTPIRLKKTEEFLLGRQISEDVLVKAKEILETEIYPISDTRATREYRIHLASVLLKRSVESALA